MLGRMEDHTRRHLHTMTQSYQYASMYAHAMKHLRDLRKLHDRALSAKRAYHNTLSTNIRDQIHITETHRRWQQHVAEPTQVYYNAKQTSFAIYMDNATMLGLYKRYQGRESGVSRRAHSHLSMLDAVRS